MLQPLQLHRSAVTPDYGGLCFSGIPGTVESALCGSTARDELPRSALGPLGDEAKRVILVLVDAFGWSSFERASERHEFLQPFQSEGLSVRCTSQFPSSTAAHVSSLHAGAPVYETGVCGWFFREPTLGRVINPFSLRFAGARDDEAAQSPDGVLPPLSFSRDLEQRQVHSRKYVPESFALSPYNLHFNRRDELVPCSNRDEAVRSVRAQVDALGDQRQFHQLYIPEYDTICHRSGVESAEAKRTLDEILSSLQPLISLTQTPGTLLLVTADHGQVRLDPRKEIYLNEEVPELLPLLETGSDGEPLRFGGQPRNLFLYPRSECIDDALYLLRSRLNGFADVFSQEQCESLGLLGPKPVSSRLRERFGKILVLPHDKNGSVSWHEPPRFTHDYISHHGGLSSDEMEIPLLALRSG